MSTNAELQINLDALKRQDPYISSITDSSTHVAVYSFIQESNEWEKTDVEGTLFVYKRVAPPHLGFTIMNRLNMENLTEPLTSELEFQNQNPFLLYRNAKLLIYGIWFYDHEDCTRIGELLEKLCNEPQNHEKENVRLVNLFAPADPPSVQDPTPKSVSPASNSINSVSPGSSVGGLRRAPSNHEEADSESEDKEVTQNNKTSVNILDLLSKAQDKYEKEKRNTPDLTSENLQNGSLTTPTDSDRLLVKPVAMKPSHPQKLDVASLFKQPQTKPPDANVKALDLPNSNPPLPNVTLPPRAQPYTGMVPQTLNNAMIPHSTNMSMPQPARRAPLGRSFSLTEVAMRKQMAGLNSYMNGAVSVEEVEANMNKNAVSHDVNSTLDKMIDRINSGGHIGGAVHPKTLPGIQEHPRQHAAPDTSGGVSGSMVVNGATIASDDVFPTSHPLYPFSSRFPTPNPMQFKPTSMSKQRSMSTSGVPSGYPTQIPPTMTQMLTRNIPEVPPTSIAFVPMTTTVAKVTVNPRNDSSLLLHGNAVAVETPAHSTYLASSSETNSTNLQHPREKSKGTINSLSKVNDTVSPVSSATLISPEDFERSATTPQKKLELKNRLLRDMPQIAPPPAPVLRPATPKIILSKEQLQQTLITLLQNDPVFLSSIHEAYMTNFQPS